MNKPETITHIPILIDLINKTKEDVLELGMGIGSTPLLHMICGDRKLVSYDNDKNYCEQFALYRNNNHEIIFVDNWDKALIDKPWSVVLVDHRPALRRRIDIVRLKDYADYIVCHDSEPEIDRFYRYSSIYKFFKYRRDFATNKANTTILSNKYAL